MPSHSQGSVVTSFTPGPTGSKGPELGGLHQRWLSRLSQAGVCSGCHELNESKKPLSSTDASDSLAPPAVLRGARFSWQNRGWPREPGERAGATSLGERGGLRGGMASGGGSLGLIACLLLLQPKPCEAWAAASVGSTSGFPSGLSEAPTTGNPQPPTQVHTSKVTYERSTTRSPFANLSIGNLERVIRGKGRTVSRPRVGANDTLNLRDTDVV